MPTEKEFVENQDRTYFNIHKAHKLPFDDRYWDMNEKGNLPQSEKDRQTGGRRISTRDRPDFDDLYLKMNKKKGSLPPNATRGSLLARNNYDPTVSAPINRVYEYSPQYQIHARPLPINQRNGAMTGGGHPHPKYMPTERNSMLARNNYDQSYPAPLNKVYEYSTQYQLHAPPSDPIRIMPNRGATIQGRLSQDDFKPFSETAQWMNSGQFRHSSHNPPQSV